MPAKATHLTSLVCTTAETEQVTAKISFVRFCFRQQKPALEFRLCSAKLLAQQHETRDFTGTVFHKVRLQCLCLLFGEARTI